MSEVARLRKQIELECEAIKQMMSGLALAGRHEIINNRYKTIGGYQEELGKIVGEDEAAKIAHEVYMTCDYGWEEEVASLDLPPGMLSDARRVLEQHGCRFEECEDHLLLIFPAGTTMKEVFPRTLTERYRVKLPDGYELILFKDAANGNVGLFYA